MPKLTPPSWQTLVRIFEADGFEIDRQEGSHIVMVKPGVDRPVIIPKYDEIAVFIVKNNMRTAGMSRQRYFELLGS